MAEGMGQAHPAIIQRLFDGLAAAGGVNGSDAAAPEMFDDQVTGPEITLNQEEVTRGNGLVEPGKNGLEKSGDRLRLRRDIAPEAGDIHRWQNDIFHPKLLPGLAGLGLGKAMIEEKIKIGH